MGLENIGKHIVGDSKWEKLYDGCPTPSSSSPGLEEDPEVPKVSEAQPGSNKEREVSPQPPSTTVLSVGEQVGEDQRPEQGDSDEGITQNKEEHYDPSIQMKHEQLLQVEEEAQGNSPSGSPSNSCSNAEVGQPESPQSAPAQPSEISASEDKNNGVGGNAGLVDNLFQILPYWYLLNRAFGLSNSSGAQGDIEGQDTEVLGEEDEEEEEGREEGQVEERRTSRCMSPPMDNCSSAATQRLNSILILESLRQQFQANGQTEFSSAGQATQQGYLSELIGRMGGDGGESAHSWFMEQGRTEAASAAAGGEEPEGQDMMEEEPLDLTNSSKSRESGLDDGARRLHHHSSPLTSLPDKSRPPFMLDEQTSKVFRSNPRSSKGYTAQELQAALHDIQSGKLGTRRAAVIYGIPRSTLRNKVYKLGKDRGRFFTASQHPTTRTNINNNSLYSNNKEGSVPTNSLSGKLSYLQGLNPDYLLQQRGYDPTMNSSRFLNNSSSQLSDEERDDGGSQGLYWKPARHSTYSVSNGERNMDERTSPPKIPSIISQSSLSQLISKPSKRAHSFHTHHQQQAATSSSPGSMEVGMEDSCLSGGEMEHGPVGHMLNEQLFCLQQRSGGTRDQEHHRQHPSSLLHSGQRQHVSCEDTSGSNDLAGKKSRPKRGKYRNYDREALVKAVRAVQNGEMSVHRAGSFFGVPHSTLEYKVKERHLLRRPKRKDVTSPLSHAKSSSPENSSDGTILGCSRQPSAPSPTSSPILQKTVGGNKGGAASVVSVAGNALKRHRHHSIFPLTSDLRESLNRYLSTEQPTNGTRNHGSFQSHLNEMELDDGVAEVDQVTRTCPPTRNRERSESENEQLLGLDSFIGNRLSNLFQLNDILLRGKTNGPDEPRDKLLDLTKK